MKTKKTRAKGIHQLRVLFLCHRRATKLDAADICLADGVGLDAFLNQFPQEKLFDEST